MKKRSVSIGKRALNTARSVSRSARSPSSTSRARSNSRPAKPRPAVREGGRSNSVKPAAHKPTPSRSTDYTGATLRQHLPFTLRTFFSSDLPEGAVSAGRSGGGNNRRRPTRSFAGPNDHPSTSSPPPPPQPQPQTISLPELLRQIKSACCFAEVVSPSSPCSGSYREFASNGNTYGAASAVMTFDVRGRHPHRLSTTSAMAGPPDGRAMDTEALIENIERLQAIVFPSRTTHSGASGRTAFSPAASPMRTIVLTTDDPDDGSSDGVGGDANGKVVRSRTTSSKPAGSQPSNPSPPRTAATRKKYWKVLMDKSTGTFPLLMAAARTDVVSTEARVAAALLSVLYSILRTVPEGRQRKVVRFCEKLGLVRVCGTVLRSFNTPPRAAAGDAVHSALLRDSINSCSRACEAAALLLVLCASYDAKVSVAVRLSRDLAYMFAATNGLAALIERRFCQGGKSSDFSMHGCTTGEGHAKLLDEISRLRTSTICATSAFLHITLALFALSKSQVNAQALGPQCVTVCAHVLTSICTFLIQVAPKLVTALATPLVTSPTADRRASSAEDSSIGVPGGNTSAVVLSIPGWLVAWLRHLELLVFWSAALLQRVCAAPTSRAACCEAANKEHIMKWLVRLIGSDPAAPAATAGATGAAAGFSTAGALTPPLSLTSIASKAVERLSKRRPEVAQVALLAIGELLQGARAQSLDELADCGGLQTVVQRVLSLPEPEARQWHSYLLRLCVLYGISLLPSSPGVDPLQLTTRMPSSVRARSAEFLAPRLAAGCQSASTSKLQSPMSPTVEATEGPSISEEDCGRPDADMELLLIDRNPDWYSPELQGGKVEAPTTLPPLPEVQFPWEFTAQGPPRSGVTGYTGGSCGADAADRAPLRPTSNEERIGIFKRQIDRLRLLNERNFDSATQSITHHTHKVVYERDGGGEHGVGLSFASNFESGNLQRAIRISEDEYDLVLSWDTSTNSYIQWFLFSITNYEPGRKYRFNIVNMEKGDSTFNEGQRPLMMHVPPVTETNHMGGSPAQRGAAQCEWQRVGTDIAYFKNSYVRPPRDHLYTKERTSRSAGVLPSQLNTSVEPRKSRRPPARRGVGKAPRKRAASVKLVKRTATSAAGGGVATALGTRYFTLTFAVEMPTDERGMVFLTNCFPFTYSEMRHHLDSVLLRAATPATTAVESLLPCIMVQSLCSTTGGLPVPLLTATALQNADTGEPFTEEEIHRRPVCLLAARVHPGESNSSWVMQGLLDFLVSLDPSVIPASSDSAPLETSGATPTLRTPPRAAAQDMLENFVFKIIPMINPDGVVMGNHRCSLAGFDLNRDYLQPLAELNPAVYAMKQLLAHITRQEQRRVILFADFHGHSRAKNFLLYGCTPETIGTLARRNPKSKDVGGSPTTATASGVSAVAPEKFLPALLSLISPAFNLPQSHFAVQKSKRNSARVVMYKELGIRMSFGVEGTMMGGHGSQARCHGRERSDSIPAAEALTIETHYTQETFREFGHAFMQSLHMILRSERSVNAAMDLGVSEEPHLTPVMQCAWAMLASSDSGRAPPRLVAGSLRTPLQSQVQHQQQQHSIPYQSNQNSIAVGPYALATRTERRHPHSPSGTSPASESLFSDEHTGLSLEEKRDLLRCLLRGDQLQFDEADYASSEENSGADDEDEGDDFDDGASTVAAVTGTQRRHRNDSAAVTPTSALVQSLTMNDNENDESELGGSSSDLSFSDAEEEEEDDDDQTEDDGDDAGSYYGDESESYMEVPEITPNVFLL